MKYFTLYKPYNYLSQFTREVPEHQTLKDLYDFPKEVYPVGRLDRDSEGLLILTNDNFLKTRLLEPKYQHKRIYHAQVERIPTKEAIQELSTGVTIRVNKKAHQTQPALVKLLEEVNFPERNPPIRVRKNIPTAWLELTLTEGKNRQVRRMCAAVGFPVLRLVRVGIENLALEGIKVGEVKEWKKAAIYEQLNLS